MMKKNLSLRDFKKLYKMPSTKKEYFDEYFSRLNQSDLEANPELLGAINYDKQTYFKSLGKEEKFKIEYDPEKLTDQNKIKIIDKLNDFTDKYQEFNEEKKENDKEVEKLKKDLNQFLDPFKKIMQKDILLKRDDIQFGKIKDEYNKRNIKVPKLDQFKSNVFKPSLLIIEKSEINNYFFFGINTNVDSDNDQINYLNRLGAILNNKKMGKEETVDDENENDVVKELRKAERRANAEIERKRLQRHYDKWESENMKVINNVKEFAQNVTQFNKFFEKENHEYYLKNTNFPKTAKDVVHGKIKAMKDDISPLKRAGNEAILPKIESKGPLNQKRGSVFYEGFRKRSGSNVMMFKGNNIPTSAKDQKKNPKRKSLLLKNSESCGTLRPSNHLDLINPEEPSNNAEATNPVEPSNTGEPTNPAEPTEPFDIPDPLEPKNQVPLEQNNQEEPNNNIVLNTPIKPKKSIDYGSYRRDSKKNAESFAQLSFLYKSAVSNKGRGNVKEIEKYFSSKNKPIKINLDPKESIINLYEDRKLLFRKDFVNEEANLIRKKDNNLDMTNNEKKYMLVDTNIEKKIHKCEGKLLNLACEQKNKKISISKNDE